jgi:hypothetical protein
MRFPVELVAFFSGSSENDFSGGFSVLNGNPFVSDSCDSILSIVDLVWLNCG